MDLIALLTAVPAAPYAWSLVLAGAVVIVSIVPLGAARSQADFTMADMNAPRAMFDRLPAWGSGPVGPIRTVLKRLVFMLLLLCWL